jgi:hypothetical protein
VTYRAERIVRKPEVRMTKLRLIAALGLAVCCAAASLPAAAQQTATPAQTRRAARTAEGGKREKMSGELKLNAEEEKLVLGSKAAIVITGLSEAYFDAHFRLVRVVNTQGSRQVVWKYSLGEYETTLTDIVGFYTAGGVRVDTHSITGTLGSTYEIRETIPMLRAAKAMRDCIGRYAGAAVVYQRLSADGQTGLYLTAQASGRAPRAAGRGEREKREREERAQRQARRRGKGGAGSGEPIEMREDDEDVPPLFIGYVNLETGRCLKAQGVAR